MVRSRGGLKGICMRIEHLYRYPVKGLTAEALEDAAVEEGGGLPWDRAFALAFEAFDPAAPQWLPKTHFLCLMRDARAAALRANFDPRTGRLLIRAPDGTEVVRNALDPEGREAIGRFLAAWLGAASARFHHVPGHVFQDEPRPVVSLINLASLDVYAARLGAARDRMRFRANVYFSAPPWSERDWVGRQIQVGSAVLEVVKPIACSADTGVNPETAERDADPPAELERLFGHAALGVYAVVVDAGTMAVGDGIEVLPD